MRRSPTHNPDALRRLARHAPPPVERGNRRVGSERHPLIGLLALPWRLWRFVRKHPRATKIVLLSLLGLVLVVGNLRAASVFLLVGDVSLPFVVWAAIFGLLGYGVGKWVEWSLRWRLKFVASRRQKKLEREPEPLPET